MNSNKINDNKPEQEKLSFEEAQQQIDEIREEIEMAKCEEEIKKTNNESNHSFLDTLKSWFKKR